MMMICLWITKVKFSRIASLEQVIGTTRTGCELIQLEHFPLYRSCIWFTDTSNDSTVIHGKYFYRLVFGSRRTTHWDHVERILNASG